MCRCSKSESGRICELPQQDFARNPATTKCSSNSIGSAAPRHSSSGSRHPIDSFGRCVPILAATSRPLSKLLACSKSGRRHQVELVGEQRAQPPCLPPAALVGDGCPPPSPAAQPRRPRRRAAHASQGRCGALHARVGAPHALGAAPAAAAAAASPASAVAAAAPAAAAPAAPSSHAPLRPRHSNAGAGRRRRTNSGSCSCCCCCAAAGDEAGRARIVVR